MADIDEYCTKLLAATTCMMSETTLAPLFHRSHSTFPFSRYLRCDVEYATHTGVLRTCKSWKTFLSFTFTVV